MKRLTLDETWKLCLSMWRWIAKQKREGSKLTVYLLKSQWLKEHRYKPCEVEEDCFFCGSVVDVLGNNNDIGNGCGGICPGQKVDKDFDCQSTAYNYFAKPIAFYNKLVSLNRKRLKGKKK